MIYFKRIAFFFMFVGIFFILAMGITIGVTEIKSHFGMAGLGVLTAVAITAAAIFDVKLDQYLMRKEIKAKEDADKAWEEAKEHIGKDWQHPFFVNLKGENNENGNHTQD